MKKTELDQYANGFENGIRQLRGCDKESATADIMRALGVNNRASYSYYRTGKQKPKINQIIKVEQAFARYGVHESIWGDSEKQQEL